MLHVVVYRVDIMVALLGDARCLLFFFFNDTATTEIYTLSLHDALPISVVVPGVWGIAFGTGGLSGSRRTLFRSGEHTSELQSPSKLLCRLLLGKKKKKTNLLPNPCSTITRTSSKRYPANTLTSSYLTCH